MICKASVYPAAETSENPTLSLSPLPTAFGRQGEGKEIEDINEWPARGGGFGGERARTMGESHPMEEVFPRLLSDWSAYFAMMGGAAATLLGLLFVAVSLRLNIFQQRNVADVRRLASVILGAFLTALVISGFTLAPQGRREILAIGLLVIGIAGMAATVSLARLRWALATPSERAQRTFLMQGVAIFLTISAPYGGALLASFLFWQAHPDALGWLAVVEASFLVVGTGTTWLLLSRAGGQANAA
jgi:hypothetical protein